MKKMLVALLSGLLVISNANMIYAEETEEPVDESGYTTTALLPETEEITPAEETIDQEELLSYSPVDDDSYDVNADGVTDIKDAECILEYAVLTQTGEEWEIDDDEYPKWDVFEDGMITSFDAYMLIVWIGENQPDSAVSLNASSLNVQNDGTVTVPLYDEIKGWDDEDKITTNGLYRIEYDSDATSFVEAEFTADCYYLYDDAENSQVWIAFADEDGFAADEAVSEMVFTKPSETTVLTITTMESNDFTLLGDEVKEVEIIGGSDPITVEAVSLSLQEKIEARFYVYVPESEVETTDIHIDFDGETYITHAEDITPKNYNQKPCRIVSVATYSKQMRDDIKVTVTKKDSAELKKLEYKDDDVTEGLHYKIEDYVEAVVKNSSNEDLKDLVQKMDNYGRYSQLQFNYRTDTFSGVYDFPEDYDDSRLSQYGVSHTGAAEGIEYAAGSLMLESDTGLRVYYNLTGTDQISDYTFTVDGTKVVTPVKRGNQYYIAIKGIQARHMHKAHTVAVTDKAGNTLTTTYSGLSYPAAVVASTATTDTLKNLCRAIDLYAEAALAYFGE